MGERVCPPWIGYLLIFNPLRRLVENPDKLLGSFVRPGMTVVEPGPGMGYFTLPLARMVGESGRIVVLDVQARMLEVLRKRARRAGLASRIDSRLVADGLDLNDLEGRVGFIPIIHVAHEVPDLPVFFAELRNTLAPDGRMLLVEPKGHVSEPAFEETMRVAADTGLQLLESDAGRRRAVLGK